MRALRLPVAAALAAITATTLAAQSRSPNATLTAVPGIKVGHHTLRERPTGCTVVLAEAGVTAAVDVRGAAPATRETDLLDPVNSVQVAHAIVLAGGSAFGLDAASGVMRFLEEKKIGFEFGPARVPIVPAAALFDLGVGNGLVRPTADCGYAAAGAATTAPVLDGSVGAGAGATIGKSNGSTHAMKGGIGSASIELPNGLIVSALVAVNAFGDVIDPATGAVVAGVRSADGRSMAFPYFSCCSKPSYLYAKTLPTRVRTSIAGSKNHAAIAQDSSIERTQVQQAMTCTGSLMVFTKADT